MAFANYKYIFYTNLSLFSKKMELLLKFILKIH